MATRKTKRYFIVNPAGAIHEVTKEHAAERLRQAGYRKATVTEVKKLQAANGKQVWKSPICEPWDPTPEAIELD